MGSTGKQSAGILLYKFTNQKIEFLLVHPGGPFWANKDEGAWSIPKGEFEDDEEPLDAAIREFHEETGMDINGDFISLEQVRQKSGKIVHAFALEKNIDPKKIKSNTFSMEWPPKSGSEQEFPEIDKAEWFDINTAREKINPGQAPLLDDLITKTKHKL